MVGTVPLAIWVTHTATAQTGNEQARCSSVMQPVHEVIIKNDQAVPDKITALQCDTLEFVNEDSGIILMAFGPHEHHISYDGVSERALGPGQSFSVKLVQVGTFHFHNHITDGAQGNFTVSK
jgi:plastocyanin